MAGCARSPGVRQVLRTGCAMRQPRGYWQAFQAVIASIKSVLDGANAGRIADRRMFTDGHLIPAGLNPHVPLPRWPIGTAGWGNPSH